jgi:hypothetical protein
MRLGAGHHRFAWDASAAAVTILNAAHAHFASQSWSGLRAKLGR